MWPLTHQESEFRHGRKEVEGPNPTFRDQVEEDEPTKEEQPMR